MAGSGRNRRVPDDEILQVFRDAADPVLTSTEVANELDIGRRGTYKRLVRLADDGQLKMKKVSERGVVWWHPESLQEKYREG